MNPKQVVVSEFAETQCQRWGVSREELVQARVDGTVLFAESEVDGDRVVIWGPRRDDGTHLHIVCEPIDTIGDFRPLSKPPSYHTLRAQRYPGLRFPEEDQA